MLGEYVARMVEVAGRFGVRPELLLKGTGVHASMLERGEGVSRPTFFALVQRALTLTREPGLGFHYGLSLKLSAHGAPGLLAMTSGTLRDALAVAERFVHLRAVELDLSTSIQSDEVVLEFEHVVPVEMQVFAAESFLVSMLQMARTLVGHPIPARCAFRFAEPPHYKRFAHLLTPKVRFSSAKNELRVPIAVMNEAVVTSDGVTARRIERELQAELHALEQSASYLSRVRRQLRPTAGDLPSLEELASRLHTSTRTLKRKLAAHGTSYRQLVEELRRERAVTLLRDSDHSVARIAELLGYTDTASFHRAYKRWFNTTPRSLPP